MPRINKSGHAWTNNEESLVSDHCARGGQEC
jgi:hypothetical protein